MNGQRHRETKIHTKERRRATSTEDDILEQIKSQESETEIKETLKE